jgi:hypothetical protein
MKNINIYTFHHSTDGIQAAEQYIQSRLERGWKITSYVPAGKYTIIVFEREDHERSRM